jgi:outer membrane biosynthesis protein TonB
VSSQRPRVGRSTPAAKDSDVAAGSATGTDAGPAMRGHAPRVPFAVLILALIGGGLCALLALNTATAASEVRQRNVDAATAALNDKEQQLSRDVAALQSPEQLAAEAARLGLIPADSPAFLRINKDGSVTVLGSPAPASSPPPPTTPAPTPTPTKTTPKPTTKPTTTKPGGAPTSKTTSKTAPKTSAKPKPTRTPTPTVTLPGGPR